MKNFKGQRALREKSHGWGTIQGALLPEPGPARLVGSKKKLGSGTLFAAAVLFEG